MMYYIVLICLMLSGAHPFISVDKRHIKYGNIVKVTAVNRTDRPIYYYINLDVLVGDYWGPADSDISRSLVSKSMTIKRLLPYEKTVLLYDTKHLPKTYLKDFHVYRFSIHVASSMQTNEEDIINTDNIYISN